jgi:hypothetical protein
LIPSSRACHFRFYKCFNEQELAVAITYTPRPVMRKTDLERRKTKKDRIRRGKRQNNVWSLLLKITWIS